MIQLVKRRAPIAGKEDPQVAETSPGKVDFPGRSNRKARVSEDSQAGQTHRIQGVLNDRRQEGIALVVDLLLQLGFPSPTAITRDRDHEVNPAVDFRMPGEMARNI